MLSKSIKALFIASFSMHACADLSTSINNLLQHQNKKEKIGIYIQNLDTNEILYSYNGTLQMTPASTAKSFTAAAAYLSLGPNYHYVTTLSTDAKPAETLNGNVYIHFSGDPTLTSLNLDNLIRQMRAQGVRNITGNVVLDETVFSGPAYGAGWGVNDFENCYAAPITGAIINQNCSRFGVIRTPTSYAEQVVHFALRSSGIHVGGQITQGQTPPNTLTLAAHYSSSLQNILDYMLKYSDDVYANAIFKTMGNNYYHVGSYTNGALATSTILQAHFGIPFQAPALKDGSGLSTQNLISPQQLVALYSRMYNDTSLRIPFMQSLAISGQSGTLVYRLTEKFLRGHVYAKTGTFQHDNGGVSNLAGYLALPNHSTIAFAIMMNNTGDAFRAESLQDQIVHLIAENEIST